MTLNELLVVAAWTVATFGPAVMAIKFWSLADRIRPSWPVHLTFLTIAFLLEWISLRLFVFAIENGGYKSLGAGLTLIPAFLLLAVTLSAYFGLLGAARFNHRKHQA